MELKKLYKNQKNTFRVEMRIGVLLIFFILASNITLGQTFPDSQNPNRIENQVIGNKQRKLNQERRLVRLVQSDIQYGELLLAKEKEQQRRIQEKIKVLNSSLKDLKNKISTSKKEERKSEKKVKKLFRSVIKTTKKIGKEQKKFYVIKERIKIIENALKKVKN